MAKALFAFKSGAGKIKRTQKGKYKLILDDVNDEQQWFTDRPSRSQGTITASQLEEGWKGYFEDSSPNSVATYIDPDGNNQQVIFEQFKPRLKKNNTRLVSRISPLYNESSDDVTGLNLKKGEYLSMKSPSVVTDDFRLSQIQFWNNTDREFILKSNVGDYISPQLMPTTTDLEPGKMVMLNGTTHSAWDLTVAVQWAGDGASYAPTTGWIVQVDNPWDGHPQIEYAMNGNDYTSDDPDGFPNGTWTQELKCVGTPDAGKPCNSPGFDIVVTNGPGGDVNWNVAFNPTT